MDETVLRSFYKTYSAGTTNPENFSSIGKILLKISFLKDNMFLEKFSNKRYNIASRAAQSNSVYVSVLKIPIVHADSMSNSVSNIVVRFPRRF